MNTKKCSQCSRSMWEGRTIEVCRYCLRVKNGWKASNQYINAEKTGIKYVISDETRKKLSQPGEKNGFYKKKHTKESIEKIKNANKKYQNSLTQEEKDILSLKLSNKQKEIQTKNPEYYSSIKRKAAISTNSNWKNYRKTSIEKIFEDFLIANDIKYKYSFIIGKFQYDFRIENTNILIEIHGSYWHGNPLLYEKLNSIQILKQKKDEEKKKYAEDNGFKLKVFWDIELEFLTKERILE